MKSETVHLTTKHKNVLSAHSAHILLGLEYYLFGRINNEGIYSQIVKKTGEYNPSECGLIS